MPKVKSHFFDTRQLVEVELLRDTGAGHAGQLIKISITDALIGERSGISRIRDAGAAAAIQSAED
jgi:hypothetical protein